ADVAEERRLGRVELPELRVRFTQLVVRLGELPATADDLSLHLASSTAQLFTELGGTHQLGHLLDPMQDVDDLAGSGEHGDISRAPIFRLERPVRSANVVALNRHG